MGKKKKNPSSNFALRGFFRVQLSKDGKIEGDSGWLHNVVTDYGLDEFLGQRLLGGSTYPGFAALGTGGAPATSATILPNELTQVTNARDTCSTATSTSATAAAVTSRWYGTFSSSESRITTATTIGNIGLYTGSATSGSNLCCGATYAASTWNTNQDVNYTYEWQFNTTT